jgi:hypothetical protein
MLTGFSETAIAVIGGCRAGVTRQLPCAAMAARVDRDGDLVSGSYARRVQCSLAWVDDKHMALAAADRASA